MIRLISDLGFLLSKCTAWNHPTISSQSLQWLNESVFTKPGMLTSAVILLETQQEQQLNESSEPTEWTVLSYFKLELLKNAVILPTFH